jgi:hypothetical protein
MASRICSNISVDKFGMILLILSIRVTLAKYTGKYKMSRTNRLCE